MNCRSVFRQGVNGGLEGELVLYVVIEVDAVDQPVGGVFALTGGVYAERTLAAKRARGSRWREVSWCPV